jgi:hypothetical protein
MKILRCTRNKNTILKIRGRGRGRKQSIGEA